MKSFLNALWIAAAAALGLGAGYLWRMQSAPGSPADPNASAAASAQPTAASRHHKPPGTPGKAPSIAGDDSPLATQLERDLSMSTGVTRWLYWTEAVEKAALTDFPRLARLAEGNPVAARLLAGRWIELNPRHLFDTLVAVAKDPRGFPITEFSVPLFDSWSKSDPEAVIAALDAAATAGLRGDLLTNWRMRMIEPLFKDHVERAIVVMNEWNIRSYLPRMNGVEKWAAADPRHAAEFALANAVGFASQNILETIGKAWAKTDPAAALEFSAPRRDSLGSQMAAAVLGQWAGRDLAGAAEWLSKADAGARARLSPAFVEGWARQDSAAALTWANANLEGPSLAAAVSGAFKGVAEQDVAGAAGLVASMQPSPARTEAAIVVARKWFPEFSSNQPVKPEALAWLQGLDANALGRVIGEVSWQWAESDPKSFQRVLASANGEKAPPEAYLTLARGLTRKNPVEAMAWAERVPEDRRAVSGEAALTEWRRYQPEAAMKWLGELPPSDPRKPFFLESALRNAAFESPNPALFESWTPSDRALARGLVAKLPVEDALRNRLLEALGKE